MYIFIILLIIATIIQVFYYVFVFRRLAFYKAKTPCQKEQAPVSVVICAKDEAKNLTNFLPKILKQDYPDFEVIVVNDNSSDESLEIIQELQNKFSNLKVINITSKSDNIKGKKHALTKGIKEAKNEIIILTDADCYPASNKWIAYISRNFTPGIDIVLGYAPYKRKKGLLNSFICYDAFYTALQYFSFYLLKYPYMGVGRNLAYRKKLFYQHKGFDKHQHILSGDDDLFINHAANYTNSIMEIAPASYMYSEAKKSWHSFFQQKRRHLSSAIHYKWKDILLLGMITFSHICFFTCIFAALYKGKVLLLVLILFILRSVIQFFIFKKTMKKLHVRGLLCLSPILDFMSFIFYSILGLNSLIFKKTKWT